MTHRSPVLMLAALAALGCGLAVRAETLQCRSVNGNLTCAGSGGVSCQTVNGRTTCVGGQGAVIQSFGDDGSSSTSPDDDADQDDGPATPAQPSRQRHHALLQQDGTTLHLRTDRLSVDRD